MEFVVNDTNIFFDLIYADLLDKFFELEMTVYTTDLIISEIVEPEQADLVQGFIREGRLSIENLSFEALSNLFTMQEEHSGLSIEDCSVWYISKQNNYTLLSGDGLLRRTASKDGVDVKGLLYILDKLVETKIIETNTAADKLEFLLERGTRLPLNACTIRIEAWRK